MECACAAGHRKAVSYVRFIAGSEVVSASTDSTLRLWDVRSLGALRNFSGHTNEKNFVGLSVDQDFIACGSETNEARALRAASSLGLAGFTGMPCRNDREAERAVLPVHVLRCVLAAHSAPARHVLGRLARRGACLAGPLQVQRGRDGWPLWLVGSDGWEWGMACVPSMAPAPHLCSIRPGARRDTRVGRSDCKQMTLLCALLLSFVT